MIDDVRRAKLFDLETVFDAGPESFDQRLVLQKVVYLLQTLGVEIGYPFRWYIRGPYSPNLTADAYGMSTSRIPQPTVAADWSKVEQSTINKLRQAIKPNRSESGLWLEALASMHFLGKIRNWDRLKAQALFREHKPLLVGYADKALSTLEELGAWQHV